MRFPRALPLAILVAVPAAACQDTRPAPANAEAELLRIATDVEKDVEALRGWKFKHEVKKGVYGEDELRQYIQKKLFEEEYGGGKLERTQAFLRLVGLIPADCNLEKTMVDVLLNQVGGFYDPEAKSFYMLKRAGADYGPLLNRVLIAHELTHALDDQYVDLDKMMKARERTEDWSLAVGSVAEGSATSLMTVYMAKLARSGEYDVGQLQEVMKAEAERSKAFFDAPPYFATLAATYMCGMHFLLRGESLLTAMTGEAKDRVGDELLAAAKDLPRSTEQILHPDKYWKREERDEPVVIDDAWMEKTLHGERGWRVVHKDTVGELLCAVATNPKGRKLNPQLMSNASYWTNTAAKGWGGDRFFLLAKSDEEKEAGGEKAEKGATGEHTPAPRGVWITAWDTAKDADEFVRAYEERHADPARVTVRIGAQMAAFLFGFGADQGKTEAAALAETLRKTAPPATRSGQPWADAAK